MEHYEIGAAIGAGGMGEVYRARDTRLGRDVAIKTLPAAFADDPDRLSRLQREAKVLASLNHPNIAQIYGLGESGGISCIVMELVEGETLQGRLSRGPIPVEEAVRIARQILEALEAAHEKDIVHRDLKPANVKITPDGNVKVLDFGLAKQPLQANPDVSNSPTLSMAATAGVILGTAAYMSPEQARGENTDERSDLFSFGCVLYEMLTVRQAFQGKTVSDILASVLVREPDFTLLPQDLNPRFYELLRRCLEKDPKRRWHSAADLRFELESVTSDLYRKPEATSAKVSAVRSRSRLMWVALALVTVLAVVFGFLAFRPLPSAPEMRVEISTPPTPDLTSFALSPDGKKIVFAGNGERGTALWLRSMDSGVMRPLPGTEGVPGYPFWSPDSRSIGFFANGALKRIDIESGSVQTLAPTAFGLGGTWGLQVEKPSA
jgi:eukaryotic-like serine/threonine-protein kinase